MANNTNKLNVNLETIKRVAGAACTSSALEGNEKALAQLRLRLEGHNSGHNSSHEGVKNEINVSEAIALVTETVKENKETDMNTNNDNNQTEQTAKYVVHSLRGEEAKKVSNNLVMVELIELENGTIKGQVMETFGKRVRSTRVVWGFDAEGKRYSNPMIDTTTIPFKDSTTGQVLKLWNKSVVSRISGLIKAAAKKLELKISESNTVSK